MTNKKKQVEEGSKLRVFISQKKKKKTLEYLLLLLLLKIT